MEILIRYLQKNFCKNKISRKFAIYLFELITINEVNKRHETY